MSESVALFDPGTGKFASVDTTGAVSTNQFSSLTVLTFSDTISGSVSTLSSVLPKTSPTLQATGTFTGSGTASVTIDWYGSNDSVTPAAGAGVKFATSVLTASPAGSSVKDTTGATSSQQWAYIFCIILSATYGGTSALTAANLRVTVGA